MISAGVSIVATWIVAHFYYRKGMAAVRRDEAKTRAILDKLPESVVGKLAAETRRQLTLDELGELITEADAYPTGYGIIPEQVSPMWVANGDARARYEAP